jgi:hypothetical protein
MPTSVASQWSSAEQLSATFAVTPATLELYRLRATLASTVDGRGQRVFDAAAVATLFRRRSAPLPQLPDGSFGRLGEISLG